MTLSKEEAKEIKEESEMMKRLAEMQLEMVSLQEKYRDCFAWKHLHDIKLQKKKLKMDIQQAEVSLIDCNKILSGGA